MLKQSDFKYRITRKGEIVQNFTGFPLAVQGYVARLNSSIAKREPLVIEEIETGAIMLANFYAVPQPAAANATA